LESKIYQPHNIEKICAWGGFASVKHVTKYIQPGIELISLDPKRSASIVGKEALESEEAMEDVGNRIAADFATGNQVACSASRLVYVMCGTEDEDIERLKQLGQKAYEAMLRLPEVISTKPKRYDPDLKRQVDTLRLSDDFYTVIGGQDDEGAVIVSHTSDRVDFWEYLGDRTINMIPVDTLEKCSTWSMPIPRPWASGLRTSGTTSATRARCTAASASSTWLRVQRRRARRSAGRHRADAADRQMDRLRTTAAGRPPLWGEAPRM
jgi:hypothetical protein